MKFSPALLITKVTQSLPALKIIHAASGKTRDLFANKRKKQKLKRNKTE